MTRDESRSVIFYPNGGVVVLSRDSETTHQLQTKTLADMSVEFLLILLRRHAMAGDESRSIVLLPYSGIPLVVANAVSVDQGQTETLCDMSVEFLLILLRRHAMAGDENRSVIFCPDGGVSFLLFQGIDRSMAVTFKMHIMVRAGGVGREPERASRNQESPA